MPEIAEVETVRRQLRKKILGKQIKNVNILYDRMIESDINEFKKNLIGLEFDEILRRGKWLIFSIGDYYLCSHLRMEGKYFIKNSEEEINKHEHVIFTFTDGTDLRYYDTRKFGRMNLVLKSDLETVSGVHKQGIEPIDDRLNKEYLYEKFKSKKLPMKSLLLDQTIISGLGNIYADEVLYASGTLNECQRIVETSRVIIEEAIKAGGTTIRSYTSSLGVTGRFQQNLQVHKRENEHCNKCNTIIKRIVVGGRSTYYCENCQK